MAYSSETLLDMIDRRNDGYESYSLPNGISVKLEPIASLERQLERALAREGASFVVQQASFQ